MNHAGAVDGLGRDKHLRQVTLIGAGIHAQRTADAAGNAAHEGKPGKRGLLRRTRDLHIGHGTAGADPFTLDLDLGEAAAKHDDDARHTAVAHDEVRAETDHRRGNLRVEGRQQGAEILRVGGAEQHLRRPADPEPGQVREGLIGDEPSAQGRSPGADVGGDVRKGGHERTSPLPACGERASAPSSGPRRAERG